MKEASKKWDECLALIKTKLGKDTEFATWFQPTEAVSLQGSKLTIKLHSPLCVDVFSGKYSSVLQSALKDVLGPDYKLSYRIPRSIEKLELQKEPKETETSKEIKTDKKNKSNTNNASLPLPLLNEALSFENFCVSPCNKLPWTIADGIARQPVNSNFNPFFLYGDVGVGKTHLMQAIGIKVKQAWPDKKVVFLPMKEFQRLYQNAYLKDEIPAFLAWFNRVDVLLLDDLQEVVGSKGTLNNALFPIFNHLHQHGKQLVFTCDRPPLDLNGLEDRLIDRFKWGITEKLERPDATLRKKILTFKAKKNGLDLPQNVIDYVAKAPLKSVREIEGIVLGIMTRAINLGLDINIALAREVVDRAVKPTNKRAINFDMIVEAVADAFTLNSDVIFSKSRVKDVAEARMVIMFLAQKMLGLSPSSIGRKLGRQHSTVMHGVEVIARRIEEDEPFGNMIAKLEKEL